MHANRISDRFSRENLGMNDAVTPWPLSLPAPAMAGLVACPMSPAAALAAQDIYRVAYEQAVASTRPGRFEVACRACPN